MAAGERILGATLRALVALGALYSLWLVAGEFSGRSIARELRGALMLGADERLERELARIEHEAGEVVGREYALLRVLRSEVVAQGRVWVVGDPSTKAHARVFSHAQVLLYPRRFHELPELPPDLRERVSDLSARDYVLELERGPAQVLTGWFDLVAEGDGYRLWRHPEVP